MRRFLIFGLLGPPLGSAVAGCVLLPAFSFALGDPDHDSLRGPVVLVLTLPVAYALGILPSLLVAALDWLLATHGLALRWRIAACMLFGFAASLLPALGPLREGFIHGPWILLGGLVGLVPAALCCWLAGRPRTAKP